MRRGFTLVEMVVVLVIVAALTHVAMRELGHLQDAKNERRANAQLEELRDAATRYLADTGQCVSATNGTLEALWLPPASLTMRYAAKVATNGNFVAGLSSSAKSALADEKVYVPTGWRGPYIHLPFGKRELCDPWGNSFVATDAAGMTRLWITNDIVCAVSHYGVSGQSRDCRTLTLEPAGGISSRLVVTAVSVGGGTTGDITLAWYGPCAGLITGAVQTVSIGAPAVFAGLSPGLRLVKDSITKAVRQIDVKPGDNVVEIKIP